MSFYPLVSVLMTSYNREKYIAQAIESVMASSYSNWELIVVDDRSSDSTVAIAKSFAAKDSRIKVFINEQNLGDYPNRNKAASYATGKYLKYLDADDLIYPWGLGLLVEMMEKFPQAGWGLCSIPQDKDTIFPLTLIPSELYKYNYFKQSIFHKAPLSSIIKAEAFKYLGGFSGKQHLGDFELWHLLGLHYSVVLMPHGIVWYREHAEQQSADNRENMDVTYKYQVSELNFFKTCLEIPLSESQKQMVIKRLDLELKRKVIVRIIKGEWKLAKKLNSMRKNASYNFGVNVA